MPTGYKPVLRPRRASAGWHTVCNVLIPMRIFQLAGMLFLLTISALQAKDSKQVVCAQPQSFGLLAQCEDLKILDVGEQMIRAYSLATKKWMSLPPELVWKAKPIAKKEKIQKGTKLLLPGSLLWEDSNPYSYTLCESSTSTSEDILSLSCGRNDLKKINRKLALRIT